MELINQVFIVILFAGTVLYVIQPLLKIPLKKPVEKDDLLSLKLKKKVLYQQIKELEMDFEIGNLSEHDYSQTREDLKRQVSEVMAAIRAHRA